MALIAAAGVLAVVVVAIARPEGWYWIDVVAALVALVGLIGSRLTVIVDPDAVIVEFGMGWPRRRVPISEITLVGTHDNPWWSGWGIRMISRGWMFNNSGRQSVQLELSSGRTFRIGTDDQDSLVAAIEAALAASRRT